LFSAPRSVAFHEVDTIEVGSGVVPIQVQHPMQLAQRALTLNAIAGGRFSLGIGMSHRMVTEQMWDRGAGRRLAAGERHRRRRRRAGPGRRGVRDLWAAAAYRAMLDREGFSGPEDAAIIGDEKTVSDRLGELAAAGVDEFAAVTFDPSPEGRARTRALLRTKDD
jgi:alkanesulfonate monooxygenase SsuD/methylene tetrahydromethanopterin reductase-like flavin-dependent oxidoreductase (luciferase family)